MNHRFPRVCAAVFGLALALILFGSRATYAQADYGDQGLQLSGVAYTNPDKIIKLPRAAGK